MNKMRYHQIVLRLFLLVADVSNVNVESIDDRNITDGLPGVVKPTDTLLTPNHRRK